MEWQDADDALELVMRSRANASSANDADERESSRQDSREWNDWQDSGSKTEAESLPHGWEAVKSRSTGQTYYFNTYTSESQYDVPTEPAQPAHESRQSWSDREKESQYDAPADPAHGSRQSWSEREKESSRSDRDRDSSRGERHSRRNSGRDDEDPWGSKPAYDPKAFLDFDAKACNLQSSRELFLQQMKERGGHNSKHSKKKRSRSRKKKRRRSSSSSSSSSRSNKRKKRSAGAQEKEDEDRVSRIRKAREKNRQSTAKPGLEKAADGGTIDDD